MYKLNCLSLSSVSNACRHVGASLKTNGSALYCGYKTSAVTQTAEAAKDFSHIPPLPGQDSPLTWDGMKFEELPIAHIKATFNNTHIQVTTNEGKPVARASSGTEGFKNSRRSTPVAAQTTGISTATKATSKGVSFVRVVVKGLGPGRLSAIKGLTMGGLKVVSITDNTPVPHNGCRPRKAKRL